MRGTNAVDAEFEDIVEACQVANAVSGRWRTLFTRKYRPQLVSISVLPVMCLIDHALILHRVATAVSTCVADAV